MSKSFRLVFLAAIFVLTGAGRSESRNSSPNVGEVAKPEGLPDLVSAATSGTVSLKLSDLPVGKVIQVGKLKFVKVGTDQYLAINLCPAGSSYSSTYKGCVVKTTDFAYTGSEQTFTAPADGYYVLEVWGAQGGDANSEYHGGYGAYSTGFAYLLENSQLYINVGESGDNKSPVTGNDFGTLHIYNGGGRVAGPWSSRTDDTELRGYGGGATHIAVVSGELEQLSSYKDTGGTNISEEILIVAGAGGGGQFFHYAVDAYSYVIGGNGGGTSGNLSLWTKMQGFDENKRNTINVTAADQVSPGTADYNPSWGKYSYNGSFGKGANGYSGGGAGWYGGTSAPGTSGGGSGYIGSSNLIGLTNFPKHMTCYECTTSTDATTYTISNTCVNADPVMDCSKTGNGYARITQLSVYLGI